MSVESAKFPSRWTSLDPDQLFVVVSRLIALALLITVLSILSPHFLTWSNLINVLRQASLQFMMSAGLTIVVLTAGIDLSVGAVLGLSACIAASLISNGHVVLGIGAGAACRRRLRRRQRRDGDDRTHTAVHRDLRNALDRLWARLCLHEGRGDLRPAGKLPLHRRGVRRHSCLCR